MKFLHRIEKEKAQEEEKNEDFLPANVEYYLSQGP
jgi:hypothetical protein